MLLSKKQRGERRLTSCDSWFPLLTLLPQPRRNFLKIMEKNEVLIERERCRNIVIRKVEVIIKYREEKIKRRKRRNISSYEKLRDDILFLIDNPDYVRLKDRVQN